MKAVDATLSGVRLELFGGPVVRGAGGGRSVSPTQELLLLAVWGHERTGISRRRAIWLLWEEDDEATARHRLSQLLSRLRIRLGMGKRGGKRGKIGGRDPVAVGRGGG